MTNDFLWYPYAQMKDLSKPLEVVRGEGVNLVLADGRKLIDAIASWWSACHGYNHPELNEAATDQLGRMAHVMLGGLTHNGAQELAHKLVEITPDGLNHVFYGDSGSVGVEIALKLAVQYWHNIGRTEKKRILSLTQAYHGDTCGAMSVGDPADPKHQQFAGLVREQYFLQSPRSGYEPDAALLEKEIKALEDMLVAHGDELAAFIVEPLMQAAGGFNFYSPRYLQAARKACTAHEVLLIFDEVATGFGRTGSMFAADQAQVPPDIMILGKALTAGYFGHSATLTTTQVFESFYGDDFERAFMHGPTFMGNAVTCALALKSLEIFERDHTLEKVAHIESVLQEHFLPIRSRTIRDTRVLGATGVIEVHDKQDIKGIGEFAVERGVWLRPIDRCVYIMPPYVIHDAQLLQVIGVIEAWFERL